MFRSGTQTNKHGHKKKQIQMNKVELTAIKLNFLHLKTAILTGKSDVQISKLKSVGNKKLFHFPFRQTMKLKCHHLASVEHVNIGHYVTIIIDSTVSNLTLLRFLKQFSIREQIIQPRILKIQGTK